MPRKKIGLTYLGQLLAPQIPWLTLLCWLLHHNFSTNDIKFPFSLKTYAEATKLKNEFKLKVLQIQKYGEYDKKLIQEFHRISKKLEIVLNPANEGFMLILERMIRHINEASNENIHLRERMSSSFILLCTLLYNLRVKDCFATRKKTLLEQHYELLSTVTMVEARNELTEDSRYQEINKIYPISYLRETDGEEPDTKDLSGDTIALDPRVTRNDFSESKKVIRYQKNILLLIDSFNAYKNKYFNSEAYDTIDGEMFFDKIGRVKPSD